MSWWGWFEAPSKARPRLDPRPPAHARGLKAPMVPGAAAGLEEKLADLVRAFAAAPLPVADLHLDSGPEGPRITGRVLTFGQAQQVRGLASDHGGTAEIAILADPDLGLEEGWLEIQGEGLVEVWREPGRQEEDKARQTEYLPGDGPLRQLGSHPDGILVQGPDLTVGWVAPGGLVATDAEAGRRRWGAHRRAVEAEAVEPLPLSAAPIDRLLHGLRAELGVTYRWGGTTHRGYDCSGLVQRVFSEATGVLLPKHTGDQRHVGARVVTADVQPGDLLFATPKQQRVGHVMVVSSPGTLIHACRTEMKVIEESIDANAERYQHQGYRRPVRLGF
jgi:cell wall-associated NlpC family hydrolase